MFVLRIHILTGLIDEEWLIAVNADRKKMQVDTVSYETFEIIMDRLEKEWYNLVRVAVPFVAVDIDLDKSDQKHS